MFIVVKCKMIANYCRITITVVSCRERAVLLILMSEAQWMA